MNKTYRAQIFVLFYFTAIIIVIAGWSSIRGHLSGFENRYAIGLLIFFCLGGVPFFWAKVTVSDEGITQQIFRRRSVKWSEITRWDRMRPANGYGHEIIQIGTKAGSFVINRNCVYGKHLDQIEGELRRRVRTFDESSKAS